MAVYSNSQEKEIYFDEEEKMETADLVAQSKRSLVDCSPQDENEEKAKKAKRNTSNNYNI